MEQSDFEKAVELSQHVGIDYPHQVGDFTILGPEVIVKQIPVAGNVICWKGENFISMNVAKDKNIKIEDQ